MHLATELFPAEACLPRGAGTDPLQRFADDRKDAPHGERLKSQQDPGAAPLLDMVQNGQVVTQSPQVHYVGGGGRKLENFIDVDAGHV